MAFNAGPRATSAARCRRRCSGRRQGVGRRPSALTSSGALYHGRGQYRNHPHQGRFSADFQHDTLPLEAARSVPVRSRSSSLRRSGGHRADRRAPRDGLSVVRWRRRGAACTPVPPRRAPERATQELAVCLVLAGLKTCCWGTSSARGVDQDTSCVARLGGARPAANPSRFMTWPLRFGRKFAAGIDFPIQGFWGQKDSFRTIPGDCTILTSLSNSGVSAMYPTSSRAADCL